MHLLTQPKKMTTAQFGQRWEASREKFYRFAYCYVKNEQDALEILSEATYRAFCALDSLRNPELFDTWMCRILMRTAYDLLRRQKRFLPYDETCPEEVAPDEQALSELRMDLFRLMDTLPTEERTLLILHYFEERTFEQISQITEQPVNTVKSKVYRSLTKLRKLQEGGTL